MAKLVWDGVEYRFEQDGKVLRSSQHEEEITAWWESQQELRELRIKVDLLLGGRA